MYIIQTYVFRAMCLVLPHANNNYKLLLKRVRVTRDILERRNNNVEDVKYGAGVTRNMYDLTIINDQFSSHNI